MQDTPEKLADAPATILAFDFGTHRIGIAVGQTLTETARPLAVIAAKNGKPSWSELLQYIDDWQPSLLIVGLPLNSDGSESDICAPARKFARRISGRSSRRVVMVDERYSTIEARSQNMARRRDDPVDALAACLILQSWLRKPDLAMDP